MMPMMMISRQSSLLLAIIILAICPSASFGFVTPSAGLLSTTTTTRQREQEVSALRLFHPSNSLEQDDGVDSDAFTTTTTTTTSAMMSARSARILLPLTASSAAFFGNTSPAHAGIGTVIPFEESRKENFPGSITNSVVLLRLNSGLRKQRGYYQNKAIVATLTTKPTELSVMVSGQFADGTFVTLNGDSTSSLDELKNNNSGSRKKAMILFGPDVDIARDGTVGEVMGNKDVKSTEAALIDKLKGNLGGLDEVTLIGGLVIHRSKSGGKDAGEDCFQPLSMKTLTSAGDVVDLYGPIFGDLPTPRI